MFMVWTLRLLCVSRGPNDSIRWQPAIHGYVHREEKSFRGHVDDTVDMRYAEEALRETEPRSISDPRRRPTKSTKDC